MKNNCSVWETKTAWCYHASTNCVWGERLQIASCPLRTIPFFFEHGYSASLSLNQAVAFNQLSTIVEVADQKTLTWIIFVRGFFLILFFYHRYEDIQYREWERYKERQAWWRDKNKVCFARSVLNNGNLHMNMPAQLCCHLSGPTVPVSKPGFVPEREKDGHSGVSLCQQQTFCPSALMWLCHAVVPNELFRSQSMFYK